MFFFFNNTDAYTKDLVNYVWDETGVTVMDKTLSQFDVTSCSYTTYELQYIAGIREPIYQFPAGVFFGRIISFQLHADMTKFGFYSC